VDVSTQLIIDDLARSIGRPAILEDRRLRLVAHSEQDEQCDAVRSASIVRRHASAEVAAWLSANGLGDSYEPVRVPGNDELGMLSRLCVPVRHEDTLVGYLWFIDADESMPHTEVRQCVQAAENLAEVMHRETIARLRTATRVTENLQLLLSTDPGRAAAGAALHEEGYLDARAGVAVVVVESVPGAADQGATNALINRLVTEAHDGLARGRALSLVRPDHGALVLGCAGDDDVTVTSRVEAIRAGARNAAPSVTGDMPVRIGVGGHRGRITDAVSSYREARLAAASSPRAPQVEPGDVQVVRWATLGVHQFISSVVPFRDRLPVAHAGLRDLVSEAHAAPLLDTLECYLDTAGSAQHTAELLNLHRTSLYYRLQRIEELTGADLKDGEHRLALHLELKMCRAEGSIDELGDRARLRTP